MGKIDEKLRNFSVNITKIGKYLKDPSLESIYNLHSNLGLYSYDSRTVKSCWEELVKDIKSGQKKELLNLYLHIPFCIRKCAYCNYVSRKVEKKEELILFMDYITKNIEFFESTFSGISFTNIHIGGGTPSVLSEAHMEKLFGKLFSSFSFKDKGIRSYEVNPLTASIGKLELLRKFGFNRISFGIQTFNEAVLKRMNREGHKYESVKRLIDNAYDIGFKEVDVDLIVGLDGDTPESFINSFRKTAELGPTGITVYQLTPTKEYISMFYEGKREKFYEYSSKFVEKVVERIKNIMKEVGYESYDVSASNNAWSFSRLEYGKKKSKLDFVNCYSDMNPEPFSVFGLGPSSRSHVYGYLSYSNTGNPSSFNPDEKVYRGTPISMKAEMIRYMLCNIIRFSKVCLGDFRDKFHAGLLERFKAKIDMLKKLGKVRVDTEFMYFLPTKSEERLIYSMFFLDKDYLRLLNMGRGEGK